MWKSRTGRFCFATVVLFVAVLFIAHPVAAATPVPHSDTVVTESAAASLPTDENETTPSATTPPENATYTVVAYPTADRIVVKTEYEARTKAEAARAENGTLDTSWFDADERLRKAFAARGESDQLVQASNRTVGVGGSRVEYPDIGVKVEFEWRGVFASDEEREVIGPHIAEAFRPGDQLVVEVFEWKPEYANADREPTAHPRNVRYDWEIAESGDPPRIAFNRSVFEDDGDNESAVEVPFGPVAGGLLAIVALVVLVAGSLVRNLRDE